MVRRREESRISAFLDHFFFFLERNGKCRGMGGGLDGVC